MSEYQSRRQTEGFETYCITHSSKNGYWAYHISALMPLLVHHSVIKIDEPQKRESMISQLLSLLAIHPSFEVSCELVEALSTSLDSVKTTWCNSIHWAVSITMWSITLLEADSKPIKIWKTHLVLGSLAVLDVRLQRARHVHPPVYIACSTWHVITEEIFVYFVWVPQNCSRLAAKASQLSLLLLLLQPESLIKTRWFHLGQLWKESLPEIWCALPNLLQWGAWDAAARVPRIKTLQGSGFSFGSPRLQIHTRGHCLPVIFNV